MDKEFIEKLVQLLADNTLTPIEWTQSNEEKDGHIESEVTFKFKKQITVTKPS